MIKIRRARRVVAPGAGADPDFAPPLVVLDRPDPPLDELVTRVVDVIEVPYLKPIASRRRRDRIGCRIVWPTKLDATLGDMATKPREVVDPVPPSSPAATPSSPTQSRPDRLVEMRPPARPLPATVVGGMAAACGYVLGKVAAGGPAAFAASLAVGVALLVTFVAVSTMLRPGKPSGLSVRVIAAIAGSLALTAAVTAGAGALRPV